MTLLRALTPVAIVILLILLWSLAQGLGESFGHGLTEVMVR